MSHNSLENRIRQLDEAHSCLQQANDAMQAGVSAVADTQRALLPRAATDVRHVDCAWSYQPSEDLGGDSLNLFRLDEHRLGFFVADVCGHGLTSAFLAVTLHRVLTPVPGYAGLLTGDGDDCPLDLFAIRVVS